MKCEIAFSDNSNISLDEEVFKASIQTSDLPKELSFLEKTFDNCSRYSDNLYLFEQDDLLFGFASIELNEDIGIKTKTLYDAILKNVSERKLFRCWNYVPDINVIEKGEEIYKKFNGGRKDAFNEFYGTGFETKLPAATGIGIKGNNLVIMFLAGEENPEHLENPDQCPSYLYPEQYGKKAPGFARATVVSDKFYFISGTASIKDHVSMYKGDVKKQYDLMKDNLNTMIAEKKNVDIETASAIVYYRHEEDLDFIKNSFEKDFPYVKNPVYLESNICRKELDLEAELSFGFF